MKLVRPMAVITATAVVMLGVPAPLMSQQQGAAAAAKLEAFGVGDVLSRDEVHIITSPGLYGLGPEPPGSRYAVSRGKLIRIDPSTYQVKSILRRQDRVLD